jgi:hypothetical protein
MLGPPRYFGPENGGPPLRFFQICYIKILFVNYLINCVIDFGLYLGSLDR